MADFVFTFDAPGDLLSMNTRPSMTTRRLEQAWRDAAHWAYVAAKGSTGPKGRAMPPCVVHTILPVKADRRRDPANFQATVKRIVDGITNAGAWPDDTPDWVDQRNPSFNKDLSPRQTVTIRLEPREE